MTILIISALIVTHLLAYLTGKSITENRAVNTFLKKQKENKIK